MVRLDPNTWEGRATTGCGVQLTELDPHHMLCGVTFSEKRDVEPVHDVSHHFTIPGAQHTKPTPGARTLEFVGRILPFSVVFELVHAPA